MFIYHHAKVLRVVDGDTIQFEVDMGNHIRWTDKFRVKGINTPEKYGVKKNSPEYVKGVAASAFAESLLEVGMVVTISTYKPGKYGRWLCDITLPDERDFGAIMVKEGHAKPYMV